MTIESHAQNPAYGQATTAAAVVSLRQWSSIRVTGADRASFLHNMCTNDIRSLPPGTGCEAFFTDVKGKIVAHAFVIVGDDAIELLLASLDAPKLIAHLDRYIIREDVQLGDETNSLKTLLVLGPHAGEAVQQATKVVAKDLTVAWNHAVGLAGEAAVRVIRCDLPWCGGYLLQASLKDAEAVTNRLIDAGATLGDDAIWHTVRIESAWPLYGVDFDGANLPQEVGRDSQAIHFRKGCYLGQETVARIDALGHVNKRLSMIELSGNTQPEIGEAVQRGEEIVGQVTSTAWSPRRHAVIAMGMLRRGANDVGSQVQCGGKQARVIQLS